MLHIIKVKESVSQKVFFDVFSSFFIFFMIATRFTQKIIQRNGIKTHPIYRKGIIIKFHLLKNILLFHIVILQRKLYISFFKWFYILLLEQFSLLTESKRIKKLSNLRT